MHTAAPTEEKIEDDPIYDPFNPELIAGGNDTTTNLIGNSMKFLHDYPDQHLSFAQGPHFCIGAHVARMMIRIYFEEMGSRIGESFEIDWDRAERRQSAFTRGFTKIPIQIKA